MNEISSLIAAGGAAAAAIARYRGARASTLTPGQRYLLVVLFGLCAALVFDVPMIQSAIAAYTELPYLSRLLANVSAMAAVFSATAMVVWTTAGAHRISGTKQVWWCGGVGVVVVGCMVPLLLGTDAELHPNFAAVIASHPEIAICQASYWAYMAGGICRFIGLMRRYLIRSDVRPLMHSGMVAVTLAGLFGVLWLVWNAFVIVVQRLGGRFTSDPLEVSRTMAAFTVGLVAVGLTLPQWTPHARRLAEAWRTRITLYRLNPLWHLMTDLVPGVVARPPEMSIDLVLYRRVIEIRDVQLRLASYVAPDIDDLVARAESTDLHHDAQRSPTRLSAARLVSAIANYRAGWRPVAGAGVTRPDAVFTDIRDEAEWLAAVYIAMTSDPIVASVVSQTRGQ